MRRRPFPGGGHPDGTGRHGRGWNGRANRKGDDDDRTEPEPALPADATARRGPAAADAVAGAGTAADPAVGAEAVAGGSGGRKVVLAAGILLFLVNVAVSLKRGEPVGPNPWDGPTLEWATPSPPPPYNFAVIPAVASRHPLWEERLGEGTGHSSTRRGLLLDHGQGDGRDDAARRGARRHPCRLRRAPPGSSEGALTASPPVSHQGNRPVTGRA